MATQETIIKKRGRGRPSGTAHVAINFHVDADLYDWLQGNRGSKPLTRYINDIIRKEAGL